MITLKQATNQPPTESKLQESCLRWLNLQHPNVFAVHIPNGVKLAHGSRSFNRLKAEGVKPGFPDLALYVPHGRLLLIEMKRGKQGRVSEDQKAVHKQLSSIGWPVTIVRTFEEFIETVNKFINQTNLPKEWNYLI
jgi:hypothetical protein